MKSTVALVQCDSYDLPKVKAAIAGGIDLLGGITSFATAEEQLLLKPNLLVGEHPDHAVTTHPIVFEAVAELFQTTGARLTYGDSPGKGNPERAAKHAGILETAQRLRIPAADFKTAVKISHDNGLLAKQLFLAKGALEADGIISIAKMKTHGFTRITGAVKNQFGCIPGLRKAEYHVKMPDIFNFSTVLIDINTFLKPRLYILDGIVAMEGNGPRGGEPVAMKTLLLSRDPVALDTVFCRLIDMNPAYIPTIKIGYQAGLGKTKNEEIQLLGDDIQPLINKNFKALRRGPDRFASARFFPPVLKNMISPKPVIRYERCVNCGSCVLQCPVEPRAVNWPGGNKKEKPVYDYKNCIRCYCCQEICPEKAIDIHIPFLGRLIR